MHQLVDKHGLMAQNQGTAKRVAHTELGVPSLHNPKMTIAEVLHQAYAVGQPAELNQFADSQILTRYSAAHGDIALHIGILIIDFESVIIAITQKTGQNIKGIGAWRGHTVDIAPNALQRGGTDLFLCFEKDQLAEFVKVLGRVVVLTRNFFDALNKYFVFHCDALTDGYHAQRYE